jgi:DNA (cytosine-5)-methyltransferase 1
MKRIRLFECYSGYGGCSFALKKANIPFEIVGHSEIKTSVINIYNQNHFSYGYDAKGEVDSLEHVPNYGDITKINPEDLPDFDLISGGFPCQDVSLAGLRDLSKGRTTSVFKMLDIIRIKKPKYCILENVKGILSMLNGELLKEIIRQLKAMGYAVSYQLLNSLEHGTPQNRERVFIVCELNKQPFGFNPFPNKEPLQFTLNDLLDKQVEEKYYLNDKNKESLKKSLIRRDKKMHNVVRDKTALCLMSRHPSRCFHDTTLIQVGDRLRILTPQEAFRLMGFFNNEIKLNGFKDTHLYEASGNGWDINLVSKIFSKWLKQ